MTADWFGLAALLLLLLFLLPFVPRSRTLATVLFGAFFIRALYALIDYNFGPFVPYDADWMGLQSRALTIHKAGFDGLFANFTTGRFFYSWFVGVIYLLFGPNVFLIIVLNVLFGTLTVLFVIKLATLLTDSLRTSLFASSLTALFPTLIVYAGQPSREPLIALGFIAGCYYFVAWQHKRKLWMLLLCILSMSLAAIIHSAFAVILIVLLSVSVFEYLRSLRKFTIASFIGSFVGSTVLIIAAALIIVTGFGLDKIGGDFTRLRDPEALQRVTDVRDLDSRGAYLTVDDVQVDSLTDMLVSLPIRIILFSFTPFPWMVENIYDMVGLFVASVFGLFVLNTVRYWRQFTSEPKLRYIVIVLALSIVMFAWGTVNFGTGTRHRSKLVPVVAVLVFAPARSTQDRKARDGRRCLASTRSPERGESG